MGDRRSAMGYTSRLTVCTARNCIEGGDSVLRLYLLPCRSPPRAVMQYCAERYWRRDAVLRESVLKAGAAVPRGPGLVLRPTVARAPQAW
eukprot:1941525-Rhodomonas_salina.1